MRFLILPLLFLAACGNTVQFDPAEPIGGDTDEHGCLGPAGYTWCEARQECVREWEDPCIPVEVRERFELYAHSYNQGSTLSYCNEGYYVVAGKAGITNIRTYFSIEGEEVGSAHWTNSDEPQNPPVALNYCEVIQTSDKDLEKLPSNPAFCGYSELDSCTIDTDCMPTGCYDSICGGSEQEPGEDCEVKGCYDRSFFNLRCGCVQSSCQWTEHEVTLKQSGNTFTAKVEGSVGVPKKTAYNVQGAWKFYKKDGDWQELLLEKSAIPLCSDACSKTSVTTQNTQTCSATSGESTLKWDETYYELTTVSCGKERICVNEVEATPGEYKMSFVYDKTCSEGEDFKAVSEESIVFTI